jgi:hypothetical protein
MGPMAGPVLRSEAGKQRTPQARFETSPDGPPRPLL